MTTTHLDDDFAVVCANGHLINQYSNQRPDLTRPRCTRCGASAITKCPACNERIEARAGEAFGPLDHTHCAYCGAPMPWAMTAKTGAVDAYARTGLDQPEPELRVFVSSPGDLKEERRLVAEVCREISSSLVIRLRALLWEGGGPGNPEVQPFPPDVTGQAAQVVLDRHVWDALGGYDVYLGLIWKRMGTPTGQWRSGTEAEFRYALRARQQSGRPGRILFYRKSRPTDQPDPTVALFVQELQGMGLVQDFSNRSALRRMLVDHLLVEARKAIAHRAIAKPGSAWPLRSRAAAQSTQPSLDLCYHGSSQKLEVANNGTEPIFDVALEFPSDAAPLVFQGGLPITEIPAGRRVNVIAIRVLAAGPVRTAFNVRIRGRAADNQQVEQDAFLDLLG